MAKQTGQRYAVKPASVFALALTGLLLAGCADDRWVNTHKSAQEAKADEATCNARAEDATLSRNRKQRADYSPLPAPGSQTGLSRGETPLQLADRGADVKDFSKQFADCMESKGYAKGQDRDKLP